MKEIKTRQDIETILNNGIAVDKAIKAGKISVSEKLINIVSIKDTKTNILMWSIAYDTENKRFICIDIWGKAAGFDYEGAIKDGFADTLMDMQKDDCTIFGSAYTETECVASVLDFVAN